MITTPRLLLRPWRDDDLPAYAALNADSRVRAFFPFALTETASNAEALSLRSDLESKGGERGLLRSSAKSRSPDGSDWGHLISEAIPTLQTCHALHRDWLASRIRVLGLR